MEVKANISLEWEPCVQFSAPSFSKMTPDNTENNMLDHADRAFLKDKNLLVDGLFVPPNDPKKLNKLYRKQIKDTIGKSWFDMPAPTITPELKKDLHLLKLRDVIDPKRHYKKGDTKSKKLPKYFQVGTVIESATEYFSGRLTKKERKTTFANELLADSSLTAYRKRKVKEIQSKNRPLGVGKWKINGRHTLMRAKERRYLK